MEKEITTSVSFQIVCKHPAHKWGNVYLDYYDDGEVKGFENTPKKEILKNFYSNKRLEVNGKKMNPKKATEIRVLKIIKTKEIIEL